MPNHALAFGVVVGMLEMPGRISFAIGHGSDRKHSVVLTLRPRLDWRGRLHHRRTLDLGPRRVEEVLVRHLESDTRHESEGQQNIERPTIPPLENVMGIGRAVRNVCDRL
jgi:hypothetical protein